MTINYSKSEEKTVRNFIISLICKSVSPYDFVDEFESLHLGKLHASFGGTDWKWNRNKLNTLSTSELCALYNKLNDYWYEVHKKLGIESPYICIFEVDDLLNKLK